MFLLAGLDRLLFGSSEVVYGVLFLPVSALTALWVRPADLVTAPIIVPIAFAVGVIPVAGGTGGFGGQTWPRHRAGRACRLAVRRHARSRVSSPPCGRSGRCGSGSVTWSGPTRAAPPPPVVRAARDEARPAAVRSGPPVRACRLLPRGRHRRAHDPRVVLQLGRDDLGP